MIVPMIKVCASIDLEDPDRVMGYVLRLSIIDNKQGVEHTKQLYLSQTELMDRAIFDRLFETVKHALVQSWRKAEL